MTWAGFNSSLVGEDSIKSRAVIGGLPLFPDKTTSVPMVKHAMHEVKDDSPFLSPGQTPVLGMDQLIYAIGKLIQWKWCNTDLGHFILSLSLRLLRGSSQMDLDRLWYRKSSQTDTSVYHCSKYWSKNVFALPLFYFFTGCDTTSSFMGIGKTTAQKLC